MYTCRVVKYIWKDSGQSSLFEKVEVRIDLPFTPSVGMEINTEEWFTGKIQRVIWSPKKSMFTLLAEDEIPSSDVDAEFLLSNALDMGWKTANNNETPNK